MGTKGLLTVAKGGPRHVTACNLCSKHGKMKLTRGTTSARIRGSARRTESCEDMQQTYRVSSLQRTSSTTGHSRPLAPWIVLSVTPWLAAPPAPARHVSRQPVFIKPGQRASSVERGVFRHAWCASFGVEGKEKGRREAVVKIARDRACATSLRLAHRGMLQVCA